MKEIKEENWMEEIKNAEMISEDALEQLVGGASDGNGSGNGCCGINFSCHNKAAVPKEEPKENEIVSDLSL